MEKIRILIVDDHAVVRQGIRMIVSTEPTIEIVGEATDGESAVHQAERVEPHIILMDLVMPGDGGVKAISEIKRNHPEIKIIVLTTFEEEERIEAALEAGVEGYLLKDADGMALLEAIQAAQRGEMPLHPRIARYLFKGVSTRNENEADQLTGREKEILQWVAKGLSNKDVANILNVSEGTVKVHMSNILGKLHVSSRTEAAVWAVQMGLVLQREEAQSLIHD